MTLFLYLFNFAIILWHQNYVIADVTEVFVNMVFSDKDEILIKNLYQLKGYKALELMNEFPNKCWTIMKKMLVNDLVLSQEEALQTRRTLHEILIIS